MKEGGKEKQGETKNKNILPLCKAICTVKINSAK